MQITSKTAFIYIEDCLLIFVELKIHVYIIALDFYKLYIASYPYHEYKFII